MGARQSLQNFITCSRVKPRGRARDQNEKKSARSSATIAFPTKCSAARRGLAGSRAMSAALARSIRITGISTVKSETPKLGARRFACASSVLPASCAATGLSTGSAIRGAIHEAKMGPANEAVGKPTIRP